MSAASPRASVEFARTLDGWDLALHRYPGSRADLPPLVLCPGYACNRYFLDFDERYSLARWLHRRGFEAWVLELRGHGYSEPAAGHSGGRWTFDDLAQHDVPTAIAHVRGRAGGRAPVWIGHSLGGLVAYAALGYDQTLQESVAGLVTLASPVAFPAIASPMTRRLGALFLALPFPQRLPQRGVLVTLWSLAGWVKGAAEVGMNPTNIDSQAFGAALRLSMCNVPSSFLQQLADWSMSGAFRSRDGTIDYRAGLARITVPALIIAGTADVLAAPEMVRFAYDHIGSAKKRYREFGLRQGDSADYGHVDLIFGRQAPEEVFAVIGNWIEHER